MQVKCYYCKQLFPSGECLKVGHRAYEGYWLCHPCYEKHRIREEQKQKEFEKKLEEERRKNAKLFWWIMFILVLISIIVYIINYLYYEFFRTRF